MSAGLFQLRWVLDHKNFLYFDESKESLIFDALVIKMKAARHYIIQCYFLSAVLVEVEDFRARNFPSSNHSWSQISKIFSYLQTSRWHSENETPSNLFTLKQKHFGF